MPVGTASFNCNYEFEGFSTVLELLEKADGSEWARMVATFSRRQLADRVSGFAHIAGTTALGSTLGAYNGDGVELFAQPSDATFYCSSDGLETDEYGSVAYGVEEWMSFSKFVPYSLPTEASGSIVPPTSTCPSGSVGEGEIGGGLVGSLVPFGLVSSLSDADFLLQEVENKSTYKQRLRQEFALSREIGSLTGATFGVGTSLAGSSISANLGYAGGTLSPTSSVIYTLVGESFVKQSGSFKFIQTQTWMAYGDYTDIDVTTFNMPIPGEE